MEDQAIVLEQLLNAPASIVWKAITAGWNHNIHTALKE